MMFHRLGCLRAWIFCSVVILSTIGVRQAAAQNQQTPQQPAPPKQPNPFETVPQGKEEPPKPTPPPAQPAAAPETPRATAPGQPPQNVIEEIQFRGARRVRQDTLQALIYSKK